VEVEHRIIVRVFRRSVIAAPCRCQAAAASVSLLCSMATKQHNQISNTPDATTSGSVRSVVDLAALQSIEYNQANRIRAVEGRRQSGNRAVGPIELEDQASNWVYLRIFIQIPNEAIFKSTL